MVPALKYPATLAIAEPHHFVAARPQPLKRALDIFLALLLLVLALPVGLAIALAIRLDSRGPVFYAQYRIGKGRRRFRLWKFRTMVTGADKVLRAWLSKDPSRALEWRLKHKLKHDPRITRVGRFLRRTSLDELPQLWNVLRGDMSLVGPRPVVEEEVPKYGAAFAWYAAVLPGLTGLWQISGRNDLSYARRIELDLAYIRDWTPVLDLKVLLKTATAVLGGRGAY